MMKSFVLASAAAVALLAGPAAQVPAGAPAPRLRYVANAGVLLTIGGRNVLIDAPIREGIPPYAASAADERDRLERARPPYDAVDAILVTHWHEDHFSAEAVAAHLAHNPRAVLVSSEEIVARVRALGKDVADERLRAVTPPAGESAAVAVAGLRIHVLRIRHNPARRTPEQHIGFLVEGGGTTVLHVGDANPPAANFHVLTRLPRVDVALVPFWYVTDDATWRRTVQGAIRPRRVVAMHIPPQDAASVATETRARGAAVTLLSEPGSTIDLSR